MLTRVCEPPPADPKYEANLYREMDHGDVNRRFVNDLLDAGPIGPRVIDLGCGPALIPILVCEISESRAEAEPDCEAVAEGTDAPEPLRVMGVDHCIEMLELARTELEFAGRIEQIQLEQVDLNDPDGLPSECADTVISNTVLHHLDHPIGALRLALKTLRPGGRLFVRDLVRPATDEEVERLVALYAGASDADTGANESSTLSPAQLLRQSLHAALTLDEIRQILVELGADPERVVMTSDRHWTLDCPRPESFRPESFTG